MVFFLLLFVLQAHQRRGKAGAPQWSGHTGYRGAHWGFAGRRERRTALSGNKPLHWANALAHQPYQILVQGLTHSSRSRKPPSQDTSCVVISNLHTPHLASVSHLACICLKLFEVESKEKWYCNSTCHQFKDLGLLPEEEE